jgi:hypothetical protein
MDLEGTVQNGVILPDDSTGLTDGTRVRILVNQPPVTRSFGERFAQFKGAIRDLPEDLAAQHDHYRLGTPKR